jgi:class 3 adenylate cyclase
LLSRLVTELGDVPAGTSRPRTLRHRRREVAIALVESTARLGLEMGVGIAVGQAIVGRFADGPNMSVLGPTINLASRLQAAAQAGEILMSDEAHARAWNSLPPAITGSNPQRSSSRDSRSRRR